MYDILIKNGLILDGTGSPPICGQVAVKDGKIAKIARKISGEAATLIDAKGMVITPGFIDSHSHSDKQFFSCPSKPTRSSKASPPPLPVSAAVLSAVKMLLNF